MQELKTIEDLDALRAVGVDPHDLIADWDIAGELTEWARTAAIKKIKFTTRHVWNDDRTKGRFHPSSFGTKCDFRLFLQIAGGAEEKQVSADTQNRFDIGTAIHLVMEYYQTTRAMMHDYEYLAEVEHWKNSKIADELMLCGATDGDMTRTFHKKDLILRCLWDYKSSNIGQFPKGKPKPDAILQTHAYMRTADVPLCFILYYRKDDSVKNALPVFFDWNIWNPIEERLRRIVELYHNMEEPEKTPGGHCSFCSFLKECNPPGRKRFRGRGAPRVR